MPKMINSCKECGFISRKPSDDVYYCGHPSNKNPEPVNLDVIHPGCPLEDAPDIDRLQVENDRLREALQAIRDYGRDGERSEGGYPTEVAYDEFAYKRIVDSYRDAASKALVETEEPQ